jgi:hypothetical protein
LRSFRILPLLAVFLLLTAPVFPGQTTQRGTPPDAPASVEIKKNSITIRYDNRVILAAVLNVDAESIQHRTHTQMEEERVEQVVLLTTLDWNKKIKISGKLFGSDESFPCEADRPSRGPLIVRHSSGLSRSLRNRAIYDRAGDWALSVDANPKTRILPIESRDQQNTFSLEVEGFEIVLRFRPRFYQQHRGLRFFDPRTYKAWPHSVAGWISWFAFFDKVSEKDMVETADVFSECLSRFGYEYFQMDDGYQRGKGDPKLWLNPNEKFPHGLKYLADYIKSKGLKPGIWTGATVDQKAMVETHPDWFVRDESGKPARGNWIEYALDASNPEALRNVVSPLYRGLKEQGWEYFKVDALRHLRYEGYNANSSFFARKKVDLVDSYRKYALTVREEIGREHFMLGCWGIRPELVGIIDGCRIGDDGFAYAGLSQYNSYNNVVWRNDPDHIELNEDAYRSTMVTSLTGSLLMLTDKPAIYRSQAIEPAKRTVPVLFTLPGQLYDVDPSRSEKLHQVDAEVSGSGPRPFDAGYTPACNLFLLEINRNYESWCVLGRTGGEVGEIRFSDLGLDPEREYYVFEFWTKKLLGNFQTSFNPGLIDAKYRSQAFCIRERLNRPQLLATSRHVTAGGVDIVDLKWNRNQLVGSSSIIADDPYVLYFTQPAGYGLETFDSKDIPFEKIERDGNVAKVTLAPTKTMNIVWTATFTKTPME